MSSQHFYSPVSGFDDDARLVPPVVKILVEETDDDVLFLKCRWQSFSGICLFVAVVGTGYAFGILSSLLETNLQYSQEELDTLASIGNMGLYMSLFAGFLYERYDFQVVIRLGAALIFIGFLYIWLAVIHVAPASFYGVAVFYFISQAGTCFHIATAVTLSVQLFPPQQRGTAIGLAKGYFGLSSAVLADIAGGYFKQAPTAYLLFVCMFIPLTSIVGVSRVVPLPERLLGFEYERAHGISKSLRKMLYHFGLHFSTLLIFGYVQYIYTMNDTDETLMGVFIVVVVYCLLVVPLFYGPYIMAGDGVFRGGAEGVGREKAHMSAVGGSFKAYHSSPSQTHNHSYNGGTMAKYSSIGDMISVNDKYGSTSGSGGMYGDIKSNSNSNSSSNNNITHEERAEEANEGNELSDGDDTSTLLSLSERADSFIDDVDHCYYGRSLSLKEALYTYRLWGLFVIYMITCGTSLMVLYDVNSITEALDMQPSSFFVALMALANGGGRAFSGYISDKLPNYVNVSKLEMLGFIIVTMGALQTALSLGQPSLLEPVLLLVGFCFGMNTSLMAINIADIFGGLHIATNFGFVDTAPVLGSYLFTTLVVVMTYKTNTTLENGVDTCVGDDCFRSAFIFNALACFAGAILCAFLNHMTPRPSPLGDSFSSICQQSSSARDASRGYAL